MSVLRNVNSFASDVGFLLEQVGKADIFVNLLMAVLRTCREYNIGFWKLRKLFQSLSPDALYAVISVGDTRPTKTRHFT